MPHHGGSGAGSEPVPHLEPVCPLSEQKELVLIKKNWFQSRELLTSGAGGGVILTRDQLKPPFLKTRAGDTRE